MREHATRWHFSKLHEHEHDTHHEDTEEIRGHHAAIAAIRTRAHRNLRETRNEQRTHDGHLGHDEYDDDEDDHARIYNEAYRGARRSPHPYQYPHPHPHPHPEEHAPQRRGSGTNAALGAGIGMLALGGPVGLGVGYIVGKNHPPCYSRDTPMLLHNGGTVPMGKVGVGQVAALPRRLRRTSFGTLFAPAGRVYAFRHNNNTTVSPMIAVHLEGLEGKAFAASPNHLVVAADGSYLPLRALRVGHKLQTVSGKPAVVSSLTPERAVGAVAPLTNASHVALSKLGVVSSCFTSKLPTGHDRAHSVQAVHAVPLRAYCAAHPEDCAGVHQGGSGGHEYFEYLQDMSRAVAAATE